MASIPREDIHPEDRQISLQPGAVFRLRSGDAYRWVQSAAPATGVADVDLLVRERDAALEQLVGAQQRSNAYLQLYRALLANSLDGFLLGEAVFDDAGGLADIKVLTVNKAFHQQTGVPPERVRGRTLTEAGVRRHPEWGPVWEQVSRGAIVRRTIETSERWLEVVVFLVDKNTFGAHVRDVTDIKQAEMQRASALEQFRLIAEFASDLAFQSDPDGRIVWISHSCQRILGRAPDEVIGELGSHFVHPEDRETAREAVQSGLSCEIRLMHAAGGFRWMRFVVEAVDNPLDGSSTRLGSAQDIDAERSMQREIERKQVQIADTVASMMDPYVALDALRGPEGIVDFVYAEVNEAAATYLGSGRLQIIGRQLLELFPSLRETHFPMYVGAVESGEPLILDDVLLDLGTADIVTGQRWYDVRVMKHKKGVAVTWRDVTTRHETTANLRRAEELARLSLQSAPFGTALVSIQGRIESVNSALCELVGREDDWLVGRDLGELIGPGGSESLLQAVSGLSSKGTVTSDQNLITSYGTMVPTRIKITSLVSSGDAPRLVCHIIAMPSPTPSPDAPAPVSPPTPGSAHTPPMPTN